YRGDSLGSERGMFSMWPDGTQETGLTTSGGIDSGSSADERTTATTRNDTEAKTTSVDSVEG
ncbi:hypothetical protein ACLOJK_022695, partial [Asimina triloba]